MGQTKTNDNNVIGVITSDNKPKQAKTSNACLKQPKQAKTSNACLKQPKQAKQAVTVTGTVTGTVTVPVTNKPPDGTAPNGAAPPAKPAQK